MKTDIPIFHNQGIRFSIAPRNRAMEVTSSQASDPSHEDLLQYLNNNGGATQMYVIRVNRNGITPDSSPRDPRLPFQIQDTILHEQPLSNTPDAASAHIIGAVTGPYVSQPHKRDEWHVMLFVSRQDKAVPSFGDLTPQEMTSLHGLIDGTLDFMGRHRGTKGFVGFSFSPWESRRQLTVSHPKTGEPIDILFPRSPVQNIGTIHGHAVMMNMKNLRGEPVSPLERFDRRMTREPQLEHLVEIYSHLVYLPTILQFPDLAIKHARHTANDDLFPKGFFMSLSHEDMASPKFGEFMIALHKRAEQIYNELANAIVYRDELKKGIVTMRPKSEVQANLGELLNTPGYASLPEGTKKFIRSLGTLKDPAEMISAEMSIAEMAKVVEKFVLLGLAYNAVYYKSGRNQVTLAIEPRWFSGASPLETMGIFKDQVPVENNVFEGIMHAHASTGRRLVKRLLDRHILSEMKEAQNSHTPTVLQNKSASPTKLYE